MKSLLLAFLVLSSTLSIVSCKDEDQPEIMDVKFTIRCGSCQYSYLNGTGEKIVGFSDTSKFTNQIVIDEKFEKGKVTDIILKSLKPYADNRHLLELELYNSSTSSVITKMSNGSSQLQDSLFKSVVIK